MPIPLNLRSFFIDSLKLLTCLGPCDTKLAPYNYIELAIGPTSDWQILYNHHFTNSLTHLASF